MFEDADMSTDLCFHNAGSESNKICLLSIYRKCLTCDPSEICDDKKDGCELQRFEIFCFLTKKNVRRHRLLLPSRLLRGSQSTSLRFEGVSRCDGHRWGSYLWAKHGRLIKFNLKNTDLISVPSFYRQSTPCGILENPATSSVSRGSTEMDDTIDPRVTIIKPASPKLEIHSSRSWGISEIQEVEWERRRDRISSMYMPIMSTDLFWRLGGMVQQTSHQYSERQERLRELQGKVSVERPQLSSFM